VGRDLVEPGHVTSSTTADAVLAAAAVVTALGVLWRTTRPARRLARSVREFLEDWNGEPARPGRTATHPIPERLSRIELQLVDLPQLAVGVEQLQGALRATAGRVASLDDRLGLIDRRVADHRRRNDRQIELLRAEVEQRLGQLAAAQEARQRVLRLDEPPSALTGEEPHHED
jgi:hypothetical protein